MLPKVSVIIVNWNGKKFLADCFSSLSKQTYKNFQIVFVDNNSSDGSIEFVKEFKKYMKIKIIKLNKNYGFAKPNNIGFDYAIKNKSKYVAILNNDTIVDKNWLTELVKVADSDSRIGSCACKILKLDGSIDSAGMLFHKNCMPSPRINKIDIKEEVFGAPGAAALYRVDMLKDVKLGDDYFDSDYKFYQEEFDLSWRALLRGWKCVYVPSATVTHIGSGTGRKMPNIVKYHLERNRIWTVIKNLDKNLMLYCLPHIILYELCSIPFYIVKGQFFTVIKARIDAFKEMKKFKKKRKIIQNRILITSSEMKKWFEKRNYREAVSSNL